MRKRIFVVLMLLISVLSSCASTNKALNNNETSVYEASPVISSEEEVLVTETQSTYFQDYTVELADEYKGAIPYAYINNNEPFFTEDEITTEVFEEYSDLDDLGRCGVAYANICKELMPVEKRGEIGQVKPSGWHTIRYDDLISDKYLYNRCHLIGYQLAGENANPKNLITGTRYMNIVGMLPFENMVDRYVGKTNNHVLYRVTPMFNGDNLVADGVLMEALSVEDNGDGIKFNVFVYNVQPGIVIDYSTGDSSRAQSTVGELTKDENVEIEELETVSAEEATYIINVNSRKFHTPDCSDTDRISESNKAEYSGDREELIEMGYDPCKKCNP